MNTKRLLRSLALIVILVPIGAELMLRGMTLSFISYAAELPKPSPAYMFSRYYNATFRSEKEAAVQGWQFDGDHLLHSDFHGEYFNIIDNHRVTTGQPENPSHTLWLFGASTVYDMEVPDNLTIASQLQRMIHRTYRVVNMGVPGFNASQELSLLRNTTIYPGDIVVFYDGINDALWTPLYTARNRRALEPSVCHFLLAHVGWSILVRAACDNVDDAPIEVPDELIHSAYANYVRTIVQAHDYTISVGANFVHFLQPTVYSAPLSADEQMFANTGALYVRSWPLFQQTPYTIDLTHCLDSLRADGAALYLDEAHVNDVGDLVIARAIAEAIAPTL